MKTAFLAGVFAFMVSVGAQASFSGNWGGEVDYSQANTQPVRMPINQSFSIDDDTFTYTQTASAIDWQWSQNFQIQDGNLLLGDLVVGTISDTGFSFAGIEVYGASYSASFTLNQDGTGNFQDKFSYNENDWDSFSGVLSAVAPAHQFTTQPRLPINSVRSAVNR